MSNYTFENPAMICYVKYLHYFPLKNETLIFPILVFFISKTNCRYIVELKQVMTFNLTYSQKDLSITMKTKLFTIKLIEWIFFESEFSKQEIKTTASNKNWLSNQFAWMLWRIYVWRAVGNINRVYIPKIYHC